MKTGVQLIKEERERQIEREGWDEAHDDQHRRGELARAGACYAIAASRQSRYASDPNRVSESLDYPTKQWPWDASYWRPKDRIRNLVRAGALIAAEIDRINRALEDTKEKLGQSGIIRK